MSADAAAPPIANRNTGLLLALANVAGVALLTYWVAGPYWSVAAASFAAIVFRLPRIFQRAAIPGRTNSTGRHTRPRRFDRPDALTLFFCNVFMLVVLGILVFGMAFALGAALIAAPIWLITITWMVARASDPDAAL